MKYIVAKKYLSLILLVYKAFDFECFSIHVLFFMFSIDSLGVPVRRIRRELANPSRAFQRRDLKFLMLWASSRTRPSRNARHAKNKVVVYSFRHSYAKRGHQVYKLSDTEMAAMMGHSTQVHNQAYAQWSSESMLEDSMKRAIKFT